MKELEGVGPRVLVSTIIVALAITIVAASLDYSYFAALITLIVAIVTIKGALLVGWSTLGVMSS